MDQNILEDHIPMRRIQEDTVLARAAQQSPAEFEALYRKWLKPVYRYFYFRLGNTRDAEDLTAQVFLKAYQDLPHYRSRGAFSAWLFTIAHARLVDHYRRDGRKSGPRNSPSNNWKSPPARRTRRRRLSIQKDEVEQVFSSAEGISKKKNKLLIRLRFMAELELSGRSVSSCTAKGTPPANPSTRLFERMKKQMEKDHD